MRPRSRTLTPPELEIMHIVWRRGRATGREVYEELLTRRRLAYTTVMSALKTLEQKGYLRAEPQDRAYVYEPTQPQSQTIRGLVREFVDRVFDGSVSPLLAHLIEDEHLTEADLEELARRARKKP
jgi:BlaI family transcriptional regulator, penicillinase repressor